MNTFSKVESLTKELERTLYGLYFDRLALALEDYEDSKPEDFLAMYEAGTRWPEDEAGDVAAAAADFAGGEVARFLLSEGIDTFKRLPDDGEEWAPVEQRASRGPLAWVLFRLVCQYGMKACKSEGVLPSQVWPEEKGGLYTLGEWADAEAEGVKRSLEETLDREYGAFLAWKDNQKEEQE